MFDRNVKLMQNNLRSLRKIFHVSCEDIAKILGVSKVCINDLERKKRPMSRIQYIALRAYFEWLYDHVKQKLDIYTLIKKNDELNEMFTGASEYEFAMEFSKHYDTSFAKK